MGRLGRAPNAVLLAWLPVVSDPPCLAAGVLRVGVGSFLAPAEVGKLARYSALVRIM